MDLELWDDVGNKCMDRAKEILDDILCWVSPGQNASAVKDLVDAALSIGEMIRKE